VMSRGGALRGRDTRMEDDNTPARSRGRAHRDAAQRRGDAMEDVPVEHRDMVTALLAERRGYEQRGLRDRVGAVDEQLRHRGYRTA
jgi:hypothetical protein